MAADANGNDITNVRVPLTGQIYLAPAGTTLPTLTGAAVTLNAAFNPVGLLKVDGGPQMARNQDGDDTEFWQDGYTLPGVNAWYDFTFTIAEDNAVTRKLILGVDPDVNDVYAVDAAITPATWCFYTAEAFKSGKVRRRTGANAVVTNVNEDKSERGSVMGTEITMKIARDAALSMFRQYTYVPA